VGIYLTQVVVFQNYNNAKAIGFVMVCHDRTIMEWLCV